MIAVGVFVTILFLPSLVSAGEMKVVAGMSEFENVIGAIIFLKYTEQDADALNIQKWLFDGKFG